MKPYFDLVARCGAIYSQFEPKTNNGGAITIDKLEFNDREHILILFHLVKFYDEVVQFGNKSGTFYFDDMRAETFLYRTEELIFGLLDEIFGEYSELRQFFDIKSIEDLRRNLNSLRYVRKIEDMLSKPAQREGFYLNFMAFSWLLFLEVNKGLLITYTVQSEVKKNLNNQIKPYSQLLKKFVDEHNPSFFNKDPKSYYEPFKMGKIEPELDIYTA